MNLLKIQELIDQIHKFLKSNDLTDNSNSRKLHKEYLALCQEAKTRLDTCEQFMKQKLVTDAIAEANKEPKLREFIQILNFPEKDFFLDLCELYDWPKPESLSNVTLNELQNSSQTYDNMRHLLNEYRTISRSDLHHEKRALLQKIIKNDPKNHEWITTIKDVEAVCLKELLERAKKDILEKQYEDLKRIFNELTGEKWYISIPAAAIEKIKRVLSDNKKDEVKRKVMELLFQIESAYSSHDFVKLERALDDWKLFLKGQVYFPNEMEIKQINEAKDFLEEHQQAEKKKKNFERCLELLIKKIDNHEKLDVVEQEYIHLKSFELPIPEFVEDAIYQYRDDNERQERTQTILTGTKILLIFVIVLLVVVFTGYSIMNIYNQKQKEKELNELITQNKFEEASAVYEDFYKKDPSVLKSSKIRAMKQQIDEWAKKEKERIENFNVLISQITEELKNCQNSELKNLKKKVEAAKALAKSETEKSTLLSLETELDNKILSYRNVQEVLFREKLDIVIQKRSDFFKKLDQKNINEAGKLLVEYERAVNECKKIPGVSYTEQELELMNIDPLQKEYDKLKKQHDSVNDFYTSLSTASNLEQVAEILNKKTDGVSVDAEFFLKDLKVLQAIAAKKGRSFPKEKNLTQVAFFRDMADFNRRIERKNEAYKTLIGRFRKYQEVLREFNSRQIVFQPEDETSPFYLLYPPQPKYKKEKAGYSLQDIFGQYTELSFYPEENEIVLEYGKDENNNIIHTFKGKIVYPKGSFKQAIQGKEVVELQLLSEILQSCKNLKMVDVPEKSLEIIQKIRNKEYCIPYRKVQFIVDILNLLEQLEPTNQKSAAAVIRKKLNNEWNKYSDSGKKFITDREMNQALEDCLSRINWADLNHYIKQYHFDNFMKQQAITEEFCYLGVFVKGQPQPMNFNRPGAEIPESGDIFCLNDDRTKRFHVGTYSKNEINIFPEYKNYITNRLLFSSKKRTDIRNFIKNHINFAERNNLTVNYPKFWPENLKGGK